MANHSSILVGRILLTESPSVGLWNHGVVERVAQLRNTQRAWGEEVGSEAHRVGEQEAQITVKT